MKLLGRVAIVTGGSGKIGRAIVEELAKEGADVVFTYFTNKNAAKLLELQCKLYGRKVIGIKCDVRKYEDVKNVVDFTVKEFGRIDILVNNAGIGIPIPIEDISEEIIDEIIGIDLKGPIIFSKFVTRYMKNQRYGKIINIASVGGFFGIKNFSVHGAAKGGLIGFTKNLAVELAEFNINVNSISPGTIRDIKQLSKNEIDEIINRTPIKRVGSPLDVAKLVVFLCSDESSYITGEDIIVDGGKNVEW
jgi:3-oxoacyl-[acyl-carrier protein] reductase